MEATETPEATAQAKFDTPYRVTEAAACLRISPSKCWDLIAQGRIKTIRIGGCSMIVASEIRRVLAEGTGR